jgi:hypothetical protein
LARTSDLTDRPFGVNIIIAEDGDVEYAPLWAGESCGVVNDLKPAGAIVCDLARDAAAALR